MSSDLQQKFNEIDNAATGKKRENENDLVEDVLDESNPFNDIKTDVIYIEDDLFDDNESKDIKTFLMM